MWYILVYSSGDKEKLLQKNDIDFTALLGTMKQIAEREGKTVDDDTGFEFASNAEVSYQEILSNRKIDEEKEVVFADDDFDIDDI